MDMRAIPAARKLAPFQILLPRKLSYTQYLERMCQISIHGRVRLYRMRQTCSVLLRRPLLRCYDHGWWRAPSGHLYAGLWIAILRPN